MKRTAYKIIAICVLVTMMMGMLPSRVMSAEPTLLLPPQHNRVADIGYVENYNVSEWYAKLQWDPMTFPSIAEETYIHLGLNEIASGSGTVVPDAIELSLPGSATSFDLTPYNPENLKHGTIYESYVKASYKYNQATGQFTVTSPKSNPAKFLTGLHVSLELIPGTNYIRIKWDDVWDTTGRINYRILISDTKGFTQPPPIPDILGSEVGKSGSAVTVNTTEKKLEYIYTSAQPGREYSIKVVPLPNVNVACADAESIAPVTIKTDILLKAQRVGFTNEGDTIWKLFWNPIVKGNDFTRVDYELYRYVNDEPQGQLFRLIPEIDNYQIIIKKDDPNVYSFKIDAKAYLAGSNAPIEFRSNNKVALKEQIPQQPEAPDIVDAFEEADPDPLYYDDFLGATVASVFWRVPYLGDGMIDTDITYDIYLLEDIKDVANPPTNYRIATDLSMGQANQIRKRNTGEVIGYRYNLMGLKSNSTYYFVIYAKKNFLVQNPGDGLMITKPYISKQAVKVIITKPDTGSDRPIAPSAPPFRLAQGLDSVTYTKATLALDKQWHALYDNANKRWEYVSKDDYDANERLKPGDEGYENKRIGKIVEYQQGWTVVPHVVPYNAAILAIQARGNRTGEYITYSDLSQPDILVHDMMQQRVSVPERNGEDQSFTFDVTGLKDNTVYVVWVTIENQNGTSSDPSDPLIVTTPPYIPDKPVTPTVPTDLKGLAADSFVDLFWTFIKDMDYEIRYGTSENLSEATTSVTVTYQDLQRNSFLRINNLSADTLYYFWIKAISRAADGTVKESQYSNPLMIKTEAHKPPAPPTGFGVKSGADGVTQNSITYVWEVLPNMSYILEFSDNANFENSTLIPVTGGTHTVGNLIANRRYYARLYAVDNRTTLQSQPTRSILVITNRSKSEYDGSYDLDEPVSGDGLIIPTKLENGVWVISSLGAQAHLLAERIRAQYSPVVQLDLSSPPARTTAIRLNLGSGVIDALADLKKELYVKLPWGQMLIRPGTFHTDEYFRQKGKNNDINLRIDMVSPATQYTPSTMMQIKTPVTEIKASLLNGTLPMQSLTRSVRVELPVSGLSNYGRDQIKAYSATMQSWYALPTYLDYSQNLVVGELDKPGPVVAATWGVQTQPSAPVYLNEGLEAIQAVYRLKSLEGKPYTPTAAITESAALKLILDVVPTDYSDSDMRQKALQARLISAQSDIAESPLRKDKAVGLLMNLYTFKTHEKPIPTKPTVWARYKDLSKVQSRYMDAFRFALENGVVQGNGLDLTNPDQNLTYGDFLVLLERTLRLCGDL
jgi:hypothetical protein